MTDSDLTRTLEALYARRTLGIKPGLEVTRALLAALGNPQDRSACLHVAGTNGKGSVCALLDAMLRAAGFRTGLYTSPHLVRFNERFRVDGAAITDAELAARVDEEERAAAAVRARLGKEPTFFESGTAVAFLHFLRQRVDVAVLETGMGGRLDATNVVTPRVAVVTRVDLDHMAYLGATLPEIAREKAGIVKPGRPVVGGAMPEAARAVLREVAAAQGAPLAWSDEQVAVERVAQDFGGQVLRVRSRRRDYGELRLRLLGDYQLENVATAVAAVEAMAEHGGPALEADAVRAGAASAVWPGRCHVVSRDPPFVLDGGHNPGAGHALALTLGALLRGRPLGLVVGMCGDKDVEGFLAAFAGLAKRLWLVPIRDERNAAPARLRAAAAPLGAETTECGAAEAVRESLVWARAAGGAVCLAGSLFLVGEALEGMTKTPDEWGGLRCGEV
jgi:dihydrofolate synthase/folylpolyglutamate synthase